MVLRTRVVERLLFESKRESNGAGVSGKISRSDDCRKMVCDVGVTSTSVSRTGNG